MVQAAIQASGLSKRYVADQPLATDELSFEVGPGELYGLLGANGSGKSTAVGMLTTIIEPTAGSATVAGFDVVAEPGAVRRCIGVTLQEAGVDPNATPRSLMRMHGELLGYTRHDATNRAEALIEQFDLLAKADSRLRTLSGGNRRRVDLALALVGRPAVVFLDEPTTGLDPISRKAVWDQVARLREEGTAVLLTTQYLEEADRLADRVGILVTGRLRVEGSPQELKRRVGGDVLVVDVDPAAEARAGELLGARVEGGGRLSVAVGDGGAAVPRAIGALEAQGITARSVALNQATLDDVFLQVADARLAFDETDHTELEIAA